MFNADETVDVVIVGGGVIGLTIARALRRCGVRGVALIERASFGAEASWAAGGILAPQVEADHADDFFRLACASRDLYPDFAASLKEETGVDVELDMTGTLYLGFTPEHEHEFRRRHKWQRREGLRVEWLTGDETRRCEPGISEKVNCALRFPDDFQLENRKLVAALVSANRKLGVRLIEACEVSSFRVERGKIRAVETSLGRLNSAAVVLAAGAWTSLIEVDGATLPQIQVEPVRGQMLCFKTQAPIARHVIYGPRGYLVPRRDGRLLAGSTAEHVGFDKAVTDDGLNSIKSMAREIIPKLEHTPLIDSWAGFRPRAIDGQPVLGATSEIGGLVYATGHYRNGILLAPITGELIAELVASGMMPQRLAPFSPDRFRSYAQPLETAANDSCPC
jgi:glycine oxidase